jgi:UDP-2,4-diacetamido-2,4,6-trideoxy-beta-L-altropyranose hydrolase
LVRADAGAKIGAGHVMRCLALAQAWVDGGHGEAAFAIAGAPPRVRTRLQLDGFVVHDLHDTSFRSLVTDQRPDAVVVDGYHLGLDTHRDAKSTGAMLAVVDDNREAPAGLADLIINQNPQARSLDYSEAKCPVLRGLSFAMLRREFRGAASYAGSAGPVLITMGGSDPGGLTLPLARALSRARIPTIALLGGASAHELTARALLDLQGVEVLGAVDDVVPVFSRASLAITGAGGTLWELSCLGVPMVAVVVADNQREGARAIRVAGAGTIFGVDGPSDPVEIVDEVVTLRAAPARLLEYRARASQLVDGGGASRVARRLSELMDP